MNKRKRVFVSVIAVLLALVLVMSLLVSVIGSVSAYAVSQSEIDALKDERQEIQNEKNRIKGEIDDLESEQATYLERKAALDRQNELARQELELISEQIGIYDSLISSKEAEVKEATEAEEAQMARYRTRMRAMEENGALSYIAILFRATSFSELLSRIDYISEVLAYDKQLEEQCIESRENTQKVKAEYEATKLEQESARVELEAKRTELEKEIDDACRMIADLEKDIDEYTKAYYENEAAEQEVQAQIDELIAELQRQEAAAKAAREAAERAKNQGQSTPSTPTPSYTPVVSTGTYIWPYPRNNYVGSGFGYRIHPIFGDLRYHSGIDIGGTAGQEIVAADSGTVVTATYSSSYGNYIVINHGGGRTTLYGHMSSLAVSVGASVKQGDIIGYCGSTGWSTGPHLHFETTDGGTRVDPLSYFSSSAYIKGFTN